MHQTVVHSVDSIYADSVDGMQIEQWMVMIQGQGVSHSLSFSVCPSVCLSHPTCQPNSGERTMTGRFESQPDGNDTNESELN